MLSFVGGAAQSGLQALCERRCCSERIADTVQMAVEQTRLQRIAFSNIGLQEQTLSGKNVETHLRALGHQCQQLFAVHEVMAVFLCEVGPVVQGLGAVHKDMIQLHLSLIHI